MIIFKRLFVREIRGYLDGNNLVGIILLGFESKQTIDDAINTPFRLPCQITFFPFVGLNSLKLNKKSRKLFSFL